MAGFFDFIRSFLPTATFTDRPKATPKPVQQFAEAAYPPPQQTAPVQPQGFKYRMGSSDYSDIAPQVQTALKGTPLEQYTNDFIQAGNKYGVDPRVVPTIANNESSLGKGYPADTYNPFGYTVGGTGHQALANAGFTSLPMAIDAMTKRFSQDRFQPTDSHYKSYNTFRQDPTVENLQSAYNATPSEAAGWIQNGKAFTSNFQ